MNASVLYPIDNKEYSGEYLPVWDSWRNAEAYSEYVERFPIYRALNQRLVELAELGTAQRVLDLACGAGSTTEACLKELPALGEIVAVDSAEAMVELARSRIGDPRVRFKTGDAHLLDPAEIGTFDRAVCNAAFWLLGRPAVVLDRLSRCLVDGGLVVFNVPAERLREIPTQPDPFQLELTAALAKQGAATDGLAALQIERAAIETALDRAGFRLERTVLHRHRGRQRELIALMQIPAMAARVAPELEPASCQQAVRRAARRVISAPGCFLVDITSRKSFYSRSLK